MMFRGNEKDGHGIAPTGAVSGHVDDWEDLAVDYLDGCLDPETKAAVEGHLRNCPSCAARLRTQQGAVALLQQTPLDDPPVELEDRVLGECLFPSRPVQPLRRSSADEPPRWSALWRRRIRPWVPAAVAVVALLMAAVTYGLLRSDTDSLRESAATTSVAARQAKEADGAGEESLGAADATASSALTYGPAGLGGTATTAAGASTTLGVTGTPAYTEGVQDRAAMIDNLESAAAPIYFVFEGAGALSLEQAQAVAAQITQLTGLEPLDSALSLGGPTFAAYVPRDDATQLVDLLRSIGVSLELTVSEGTAPPQQASPEFSSQLQERRAEFPELSAHRIPQPAAAGWSFTTSTSVPPAGHNGQGTQPPLPDEAGTHVLVVIYTLS